MSIYFAVPQKYQLSQVYMFTSKIDLHISSSVVNQTKQVTSYFGNIMLVIY